MGLRGTVEVQRRQHVEAKEGRRAVNNRKDKHQARVTGRVSEPSQALRPGAVTLTTAYN